ncbi:response regulator [candidate division WOR-3 bacterium]|nr:response regulator [candidate division WOR-3 bacterium]
MPEKHSIIIVDDEKSITELLKEILISSGYDVEISNDSEEAFQMIKDRPFDVVLTDLKMPKMSGIELIESALQVREKIIPIVMTGYGTIESAVEAMKKGAVGYIPKPFRAKNIISVIQKELEARDLRNENTYLKKIIAVNDFFDSLSCEVKIENAFKGVLDTCRYILPVEKLLFFIKPSPEQNDIVLVKGEGFDEKETSGYEETAREAISSNQAYMHKITKNEKLFVLTMMSRNEINGVILMALPPDFVISDEDLRILRLLANRVSISIENTWLIKGIADSLRNPPQYQMPTVEYAKTTLVSEIASIISHEISNPLSALQIAIDYIGNLNIVSEKEKFDQAFSCITEGVGKISEIVTNLRSISASNKLMYSSVNLNDLIKDAINILGNYAGKKKVKIETFLDKKNTEIQADKDQIRQVILNILINSIEAVDTETGTIKITTKSDAEDKCVYMIFEDNGIGISKENLERVFDPFFSQNESPEKKAGLGLALAKKVIGRHQGSIKAESEHKTGTRFTVKLYRDLENI